MRIRYCFTKSLTILSLMVLGIVDVAFSQGIATLSGNMYKWVDSLVPVQVQVYLSDTNSSTVVRGAILYGSFTSSDLDEMAFASQFGFCIGSVAAVGADGFPTGMVTGELCYGTYAPAIIRAFDAWAKMDNGKRPEFARIPFITFGSSEAGASAYGLAMYAWKRTICFGCNICAGYCPSNPTDSMIRVPGMFTVGEVDPVCGMFNCFCDTLIAQYRPKGALWSEAYIWGMGHEDRRIMHMFAPFFEQCIKECYPASINPRTDSVVLIRPLESSGYLAPSQSELETMFTPITPFAQYSGNKASAEWLLNKDIAWLYRGYTSADIRIAVRTPDTFPWSGVTIFTDDLTANIPPWWHMSCTQPGQPISLIVEDTARLPGWTKIELYRGSTLIDSLKRGQPLQFTEIAQDTPMAQAFNLLAYDTTSRVYPSIQYTVLVSTDLNVANPPTNIQTAVLMPYHSKKSEQSPSGYSIAAEPTYFTINGRSLPLRMVRSSHETSGIIMHSEKGTQLFFPIHD